MGTLFTPGVAAPAARSAASPRALAAGRTHASSRGLLELAPRRLVEHAERLAMLVSIESRVVIEVYDIPMTSSQSSRREATGPRHSSGGE